MADCILGIKCNGVSMKIDTLKIESNQEPYDYICNVTLANESNGNGRYEVSIINKNYLPGFFLGEWRITKAWISFNWGDSIAKFIMTDQDGNETKEIIASEQKGSVSGFDTNTLARSIFAKAQKIVIEYPSASICNTIMDLIDERNQYHWKYIKNRYQEVQSDMESFIDYVEYAVGILKDYFQKYKVAKILLEECEDPRAKQLLAGITNDCKELILSLKQ